MTDHDTATIEAAACVERLRGQAAGEDAHWTRVGGRWVQDAPTLREVAQDE